MTTVSSVSTGSHGGTTGPSAPETGLIVPVPEMEDFIQTWRDKVDAVPPVGVPAHVTLLYPFLSPDKCLRNSPKVTSFFSEVEPFEFELTSVGWFDRRVVFLSPEPVGPFNALTEQLLGRWTECLPYGGKHGKNVPHLTIGIDGEEHEMEQLEAAAAELLPLRCRATEAWLMIGTKNPPVWEIAEQFPFAQG